jgi:hypothetical protein
MFAVGLAAQSTGTSGTTATSQDPQTTTAGGQRGGPRTITGCLKAGDTAGTYMLTNVEGLGGGRAGGGATAGGTTAGGTTTGGTTAGGTTTGGTTASGAGTTTGGQRGMAGSIMLNAESSVNLAPHVGHKIEVTGTLAGGRGGQGGGTGTTTGTGGTTGTGTTAGGTTAGGTTAGGTTAGGTTAGGTTDGSNAGQGGGRGMRAMTVTSVKMVSDSCS